MASFALVSAGNTFAISNDRDLFRTVYEHNSGTENLMFERYPSEVLAVIIIIRNGSH